MLNMSELPVHLRRPHLLGYNFANRGFQFKIMPSLPAKIEDLFEEISIPPNGELALISDKASIVCIERFRVRTPPALLWLETVELVRIGSRRVFRNKSALYRRTYGSADAGEFWFHPTGYEIGWKTARLLALPGKLLLRWRAARTHSRRLD